ncbi:hypothetical protein LMG24235_01528 [Paraburkholderia sabiae]|nr:hypothetical protein LMG24235_01528 [Paraburkholderia sabiae]
MTDGPYQPESIHLESSLGYYLTKARNVLVERTDRAVAGHVVRQRIDDADARSP